jgi:hypothetical protein
VPAFGWMCVLVLNTQNDSIDKNKYLIANVHKAGKQTSEHEVIRGFINDLVDAFDFFALLKSL